MMAPMGRFARRLAQSGLVLLGCSVVAFVLLRVIPGDPARVLLSPEASEETVRSVRAALGLDRPLWTQYWAFLGQLLRGDLGTSLVYHQPVTNLLVQRLPATLELAGFAVVAGMAVAIPLGIAAALRRGLAFDRLSRAIVFLGQSVPTFWLGILLIVIFAVTCRVLPTSGRGGLRHLILPGTTLAIWVLTLLMRITRSAMLEVLRSDYIRTAAAKGLAGSRLVWKHALRNALIPIVTVASLQVGALLSGAVVTEAVFGWPGVGTLVLNSILARDYPLVQGAVLLSAAIFVGLNWLTDALYAVVDPRVRRG
jgi:ABC-type dipeptide/oligopeptide/nickel transport system permease component